MKITYKKLYLYLRDYSSNYKFFNRNYLNVDNLINNVIRFFKKLWMYLIMNYFFFQSKNNNIFLSNVDIIINTKKVFIFYSIIYFS